MEGSVAMLERLFFLAVMVMLGGIQINSWSRSNLRSRSSMQLSQALFIFDQSSAHASLTPDALRAFTMNKSNDSVQLIFLLLRFNGTRTFAHNM